MSRLHKAFCYFFMPVCFAGAVFLFYRAAQSGGLRPMLGLLLLGLLCAFIGYYLMREPRVMVVTIDDQALTQRTVFSTRTIPLNELDGYREGEKEAFLLIPKQGKSLPLTKSIADRGELIGWIKVNYPDVDARARAEEEQLLLEDQRFGATRNEREETLVKTRKYTRLANVCGIGLGFWFALYPNPYDLTLALTFLTPLVALYVMWRARGLIRFFHVKSSPYPSIGVLLGFSIGGGMLRAVMGYHLYEFSSSVWMLLLAGTVGLILLTFLLSRAALGGEKQRKWAFTGIVVGAALYSYGLVVNTNGHYDQSKAQIIPVAVTGKRISHGKITTYYVELSPWGKYSEPAEVDVSKSFYNDVQVRDSVKVFLKPGRWGVSWYYLANY